MVTDVQLASTRGAITSRVESIQNNSDMASLPAISSLMKPMEILKSRLAKNPNKTVNMNYLDHGIQMPEELGNIL